MNLCSLLITVSTCMRLFRDDCAVMIDSLMMTRRCRLVGQAFPSHQMLLAGHETAAAAAARGLPSISSFHPATGSQTCQHTVAAHHAVGYETSSSSSPVPPSVAAADSHSSAQQTGAALGRALASVRISATLFTHLASK